MTELAALRDQQMGYQLCEDGRKEGRQEGRKEGEKKKGKES